MDIENNQDVVDKKSTVSISSNLKIRIRAHGKMGDSFDKVLNDILNSYENKLNRDD